MRVSDANRKDPLKEDGYGWADTARAMKMIVSAATPMAAKMPITRSAVMTAAVSQPSACEEIWQEERRRGRASEDPIPRILRNLLPII